MQLGHAARADGAWRIYAFGDDRDVGAPDSRLHALADFLAGEKSPLARFTPPGSDPDAVIDVRAILPRPHREVAVDGLPAVFQPRKGRFGLVDYEKVFCADPAVDIFDSRGIDTDGAVVVVRPDQYVAHVLPLDAHADLAAFFDRFLIPVPR
jgi:phenol 2-monooxygenase